MYKPSRILPVEPAVRWKVAVSFDWERNMTIHVKEPPLRLDALPDLVPEELVAKLLNVTPARLRRWSYTGRGPATIRIAGHRLIRRTELLRWLESREV